MFSLVTVYMAQVERLAVQKEIKDGMYAPASYLLVQMVILAPMVFFLAFWVLIPAAYPTANFSWEGFGPFLWVYAFKVSAATHVALFPQPPPVILHPHPPPVILDPIHHPRHLRHPHPHLGGQ